MTNTFPEIGMNDQVGSGEINCLLTSRTKILLQKSCLVEEPATRVLFGTCTAAHDDVGWREEKQGEEKEVTESSDGL